MRSPETSLQEIAAQTNQVANESNSLINSVENFLRQQRKKTAEEEMRDRNSMGEIGDNFAIEMTMGEAISLDNELFGSIDESVENSENQSDPGYSSYGFGLAGELSVTISNEENQSESVDDSNSGTSIGDSGTAESGENSGGSENE